MAERVDPLELALDAPPTGALELFERVRRGLEVATDLVHLLDEAVPLLLEPLQPLEDLVRGATELEVVDRLTDHRQHREQRERRAEHHLGAQRVVEDRAVLLLDVAVDLLVGDEQQDAVDGAARGIDVLAAGDLTQPEPDVLQELLACVLALDVGGRVDDAQVVVERELHVHVQAEAAGQQERVVGDAAGSGQRLVTAVVDAVDEAGEAQHVFGHALAPLPACGGARQRLAQRLRGLGQHLRLATRRLQLTRELAHVLAPIALGLLDQPVQPRQLLAHPLHLLVDGALRAAQLLGAAPPLGRQHLVLHAQQLLDRQLLGVVCGACGRRAVAGVGARHEDEHHEEPDHDDREQRNHEFHAPHGTTGV